MDKRGERLDFNYPTSKDYKRLWSLMENNRVICFIKDHERKDGEAIKTVISTPIRIDYSYTRFLDAFDLKEFIEHCQRYKLEFIDIKDK